MCANSAPWPWSELGLEDRPEDPKDVRRAYSRVLKEIGGNQDAEAFQRLRGAYEAALRIVGQSRERRRIVPVDGFSQAPPKAGPLDEVTEVPLETAAEMPLEPVNDPGDVHDAEADLDHEPDNSAADFSDDEISDDLDQQLPDFTAVMTMANALLEQENFRKLAWAPVFDSFELDYMGFRQQFERNLLSFIGKASPTLPVAWLRQANDRFGWREDGIGFLRRFPDHAAAHARIIDALRNSNPAGDQRHNKKVYQQEKESNAVGLTTAAISATILVTGTVILFRGIQQDVPNELNVDNALNSVFGTIVVSLLSLAVVYACAMLPEYIFHFLVRYSTWIGKKYSIWTAFWKRRIFRFMRGNYSRGQVTRTGIAMVLTAFVVIQVFSPENNPIFSETGLTETEERLITAIAEIPDSEFYPDGARDPAFPRIVVADVAPRNYPAWDGDPFQVNAFRSVIDENVSLRFRRTPDLVMECRPLEAEATGRNCSVLARAPETVVHELKFDPRNPFPGPYLSQVTYPALMIRSAWDERGTTLSMSLHHRDIPNEIYWSSDNPPYPDMSWSIKFNMFTFSGAYANDTGSGVAFSMENGPAENLPLRLLQKPVSIVLGWPEISEGTIHCTNRFIFAGYREADLHLKSDRLTTCPEIVWRAEAKRTFRCQAGSSCRNGLGYSTPEEAKLQEIPDEEVAVMPGGRFMPLMQRLMLNAIAGSTEPLPDSPELTELQSTLLRDYALLLNHGSMKEYRFDTDAVRAALTRQPQLAKAYLAESGEQQKIMDRFLQNMTQLGFPDMDVALVGLGIAVRWGAH